jgi:hypothetical protein
VSAPPPHSFVFYADRVVLKKAGDSLFPELLVSFLISNSVELYSEGAQFESRPAILAYVLCGLPQSLQENSEIVPRLGHDTFFLNAFQFTIYLSSYLLVLYVVDTDSVAK